MAGARGLRPPMFGSLLVATLLLIAAGCGDNEGDSLEVSDVRSRPAVVTGSGDDVGVVFMTIKNDTDSDDSLTGVAADVAPAAEMHNTTMDDGVMRMRPIEEIEIPAGETVLLEPGGYHLMLIGLEESLEIGDTFEVRLTFSEHGEMTVTSEVREP